jgi:tetratricopeptide (TPR) repeat protein
MKWTLSFAATAVAVLSVVLFVRADARRVEDRAETRGGDGHRAEAQQARENAAPAAEQAVHLGQVDFQASCSAAARATVETAVALLHSFQYEEARHTFTEATKQDANCAMAYWGRAMSRYEQIWEFPNKHALQHGLEDIQQAQKLSGTAGSGKEAIPSPGKGDTAASNPENVTDRERGYIAAAAAFYRDDPKLTHEQRMHAYSSALDQLRKKFPDDVNAGAFYALSLIALSDEEDDHAKKTADLKDAIAVLQPLCEKAPNNPGPAHYLIHASDYPEFAPQGLAAARAYAKIAPDSAHALHMPSHIFVRLGLWQESIDSNIASAASAAKAAEEHRGEPHYEFHALDFLHYSYLQSGQEAQAREVLAQLKSVPHADAESIKDHEGYMTARTALELHRWKDAASLPIPDVRLTWQAPTYRVRVIGAARLGDVEAARADMKKYLETVAAQKKQSTEEGYKEARDKSVQEMEADAWLQYAEGKRDDALKTMRAAAEKEDADYLDSLAVPAREMLADLLLELKRPSAALKAYDAALQKSPNRFDSLYGAGHAAQLAGDSAKARAYFVKLTEISAPAADRVELSEAKSFLTTAANGK